METNIVCRGCYALGTACGKCSKCRAEKENGIYCVGQANDPHPQDKLRWYSIDAAMATARSMADCDHNRPIAVWDEQDRIVRLMLCGEEFVTG